MLNEEIQEACLVVLYLGELLGDGIGDEIGPATARGERELFLKPGGNNQQGLMHGNRSRVVNETYQAILLGAEQVLGAVQRTVVGVAGFVRG